MSLALLGQAILDRDDESRLAAAEDERERRELLLEILASPRENVLPDIEERVAALGPEIVPELVAILAEDGEENFWALPRTLNTLARIAQEHPSAADQAVTVVLDLIHEYQSDYVLEDASTLIQFIGPAVVEPAAKRLRQGDLSYDIFVGRSLGEIPTPAALETVLENVVEQGFDELAVAAVEALGHADAIPVLERAYRPGDRIIGSALYKIAALNDYEAPEVEQWRSDARASEESLNRIAQDGIPRFLGMPSPPPPPERLRPEEKPKAGRRARKKQRKEAKSQRKAQRKKGRKGKKKRK